MIADGVSNVKFEIVIAVCVLIVGYFVKRLVNSRHRKSPPGPWGLPIVGYLPFMGKNVHTECIDIAKKYGDVYLLRMGFEDVVVLNSADSIREAFTKAEFLERHPNSTFAVLNYRSLFFMNNNAEWKEQRRFVIQTLKDLGLGKSIIESHFQEEITHFLKKLRSFNSDPVYPTPVLSASISNNICALIFGKRYDYDDPERIILDKNLEEVALIVGSLAGPVTFFPFLKHIPLVLKWFGLEKGLNAFQKIDAILKKKIEEHKKSVDRQNIRDFIDAYIVEMESRIVKNPNTTFSDEMLVGSVLDLFGAGSETIRTTVCWCLYIMAAYPIVQKKVQMELLQVIGPDRHPEFQDLKSMPYCHAVILEVMRWKTTIPLGIFRYTSSNTTLCGYDISRGTSIMGNFYAIHHDPKHWKDPENFEPERFLSTDMKSVERSLEFYLPFSLGKRVCPGENMANMEVFLYFVSVLQKFDVVFPDGVKPTFDAELGISYRLTFHELCFIPKDIQ